MILKDFYLNILNSNSVKITFTPIELLNDIQNKCNTNHFSYVYYSFNDLFNHYIKYTIYSNFITFINKLSENKNNSGILIISITNLDNLNEVLNNNDLPVTNHLLYKHIKRYFLSNNKSVIYNSFDNKDLFGCCICINQDLLINGTFTKVLDDELQCYFEKLNIESQNIIFNDNNKEIINKLTSFYLIDFSTKSSFITDLKYNLFNNAIFNSISEIIYNELLKYNNSHIVQLNFNKLINDIKICNYNNYPILKECILFCWICYKLSEDKFEILKNGINKTLLKKTNIFKRIFCKK